MRVIEIVAESEGTYRVTVRDPDGATTHVVTAAPDDVARFGGGASPGALVEASFRFLLDREPKESILGHFDLPVIARYFPEYPEEIAGYLR